jgi:hypothetical protein
VKSVKTGSIAILVRRVVAVVALLVFTVGAMLFVASRMSERSALAVAHIREPDGLFVSNYGAPGVVLLTGLSGKQQAIGGSTSGCAIASYLVFAEKGAVWVNVHFRMNPGQWRWQIVELNFGYWTDRSLRC